MAFETLRNTFDYLRENMKQRKENRKPGQRNYMKNKKTEITADPAYKAFIDSASDKKAPFAEKTKGYYRFSREFPDRIDAQGYRINEQATARPLSRKSIIYLTVAVLILFSVGFVLTDTALKISDMPAPETTHPATDTTTVADDHFGEIGTLPQDPLTQEDASPVQTTGTSENAGDSEQENITVPEETATQAVIGIPESTTAFSQPPVEDGRFTTQSDAWN